MNVFNRIVMVVLLLIFLLLGLVTAAVPFYVLALIRDGAAALYETLWALYTLNPWLFLFAQVAVGLGVVLLAGTLLVLELRRGHPPLVTVVTEEGGRAAVQLDAVALRLAYHLDQLADVVEVHPKVRKKGNAIYVTVEVITSPDVDVPMKTQEILHLIREVVEERMGLKLGRADVRLRHAPYPSAEDTRVIGSTPQ